MYQKCLSSWDFVIAHNSDLVTICISFAPADENLKGRGLLFFSFLWLCAIFL
uniref:Uncharacterized protein n=2 Tax=Canis lupus TaxID=9612 RepID=A0A8C0TET6_CANLF